MKTKLLTALTFIFLTCILIPSAFSQGNPSVALLKNDILYYVSFDQESFEADIGKLAVKTSPQNKVFQPGRFGQACLLPGGDKGAVQYVPAVHPWANGDGAISFWIKPVGWSPVEEVDQRGLIVLFRSSFRKGALVIERQGINKKPPTRVDLLIVGLFSLPDMKNPMLFPENTSKWKNGLWHFLAVNWSRNGMESSLDGKPFKTVAFSRPLSEADLPDRGNDFQIGGGDANPAETTLLDELVIYKRKLTADDVKKAYDSNDD